nr:hypothetical protein [Tanacetum cinerariifolium]
MAGRSTHSNSANNTNPPNETEDEVTRQLNTALPNLLTQLVQALRGNRTNQREVTQSYNIKTFRASGAKEFFDAEGAVGLLTWFESIESALHITKCPAESHAEFASSILQGRALTWWNTLVQTRGRAAAIAQPWEHFKKLMRFLRNMKMLETRRGRMIKTRIKKGMIGTRGKELKELCPNCSGARHGQRGNRPHPVIAIEGNPNPRNNRNQAPGRAFALGVAEAPQDPDVVTGMDWLSELRAKIVYFEKEVQILLSNGENLEVHEERPKGNQK